MKLFPSVIVTFIVVYAFWALALFQSEIAHAIEPEVKTAEFLATPTEATMATPSEVQVAAPVAQSKPAVVFTPQPAQEKPAVNSSTIRISGLKNHIRLKDIGQLWQRFDEATQLHQRLKGQPKKVYVLYENIGKHYQSADVVIGYNVDELSRFEEAYSIDLHRNKGILPTGQYSDQQLASAWKKINYSRKLGYVLEVHTLNQDGGVVSTQMFVSYK